MLLGRPCHHPNDSQLAIARMQKEMAFSGLADFWNESVCLFHRTLGGAPTPAQFMPARQYTGVEKTADGWYNEVPLGSFQDVYDEAVYREAKKHFIHQLRQFARLKCSISQQLRARPILECTEI